MAFQMSTQYTSLPFLAPYWAKGSNLGVKAEFLHRDPEDTYKRSYCIVPFHQPLFIKALDIFHARPELRDSMLVRLGGLHLTFSYMGSDGYIMSESGQEQMWSTAYAGGSITKMVSGHAYSRALRAHTLSIQAIVFLLLSAPGVLDEVNMEAIRRTWDYLLHENISLDDGLLTSEV